jgi:hypothetical protein
MKLRAAVGAAVPLGLGRAIMCTRQTPGNPSPNPAQLNQSAELHLPNPHLLRLLPKKRAGGLSGATKTKPISEERKNMSRRMLAIVCCLSFLAATAFAGDQPVASADRDSSSRANSDNATAGREATSADVVGIPKRHRYIWATIAGGALGAGIGALLPPGSGKSAAKGALMGGGLASSLWLSSHKNDPMKYRPLAWIAGNAVLVGGAGWAICNCGKGFPIGALIGGGFTGAVQVFEPRHHSTLSKITGAGENNPQPQVTPQQQPPEPPPQAQPTTPPPSNQPPDQPPPPPPPSNQPPDQAPQGNASPDNTQTPPQTEAENLPDSPQPKGQPDSPPDRM